MTTTTKKRKTLSAAEIEGQRMTADFAANYDPSREREEAIDALTKVAAFVALAAPGCSAEEIGAMITLAAEARESSYFIEAVVDAARETLPMLTRAAT